MLFKMLNLKWIHAKILSNMNSNLVEISFCTKSLTNSMVCRVFCSDKDLSHYFNSTFFIWHNIIENHTKDFPLNKDKYNSNIH